VQVVVSALPSNFSLTGFTVLEIQRFSYFSILTQIAYSRPLLRGVVAFTSQMTSSIIVTLKRHLFVPKHVVWAIKRKNRSNGSSWAQDRKKDRTGKDSQKSHKGVIFYLAGEKPTLNRISPKFAQLLSSLT